MPKNNFLYYRLGIGYVEWLHDEIVSRVWPGPGVVARGDVRDRNLLESAVNRPFQSLFGEDAYPGIEKKAAALFHSLVANHPFSDGNKRTAVLALVSFVVANEFFPVLSNETLYALAKNTASYRERGLTHSQAFEEILDVLSPGIVHFETVRAAAAANAGVRDLFETAQEYCARLRSDSRNSVSE